MMPSTPSFKRYDVTTYRFRRRLATLAIMLWVSVGAVQGAQPSTAFTFQGNLHNSSGAVTGLCDFQFRLFDSESSRNQIGSVNSKANVALADGLFMVTLDFGAVFNGAVRWLETQVRCPAGSGTYLLLSPRQPLRPTPYALHAENAESVNGAAGDFVATGDLRSVRDPASGDVGGAVVLENSATKNSWSMAIRAVDGDQLAFDFWDETIKNWRFGARLDEDSNFEVQGTIAADTLTTNSIVSHGFIESNRVPDQSNSTDGGSLVLANGASGNRWELPVRADSADSLYFRFWNASRAAWWNAVTLASDGTMEINQNSATNSTILSLNHAKAGWRFHVDPTDHAELGIYDPVRQVAHWNVLDIDTATGNVGIGMNASPEYPLYIYDQATISTDYIGSKTMFQLHHPSTQWFFHFDSGGHPEFMVKDLATDQFTFNVLDIDPPTGHVGIGGDATTGDQLRVEGNFTATGTKAATVDAGVYGQRKLYAVEAADVRFSDEGMAQLIDGEARVDLDPIFVETIEAPYLVHVTPYGDAGLYVAERGATYFVVKARDGDQQVEFAWRLSAKRRGYGDVRLEQVGEAEK